MKTQDSNDHDQDIGTDDRTFQHGIQYSCHYNDVVSANELKLAYENNFEEKGFYCIFESQRVGLVKHKFSKNIKNNFHSPS